MGQCLPAERQSRPQQSHVPQPIWNHAGCRFVHPKNWREIARYRDERALRGCQGAGLGTLSQTLAERGFLTIAFVPSFTGESGGQPRGVSSPGINTEDFSTAVDYLSTRGCGF